METWQLCVQASVCRQKAEAAHRALQSPNLDPTVAAPRIRELLGESSNALAEIRKRLKDVAAPPQPAAS